MFTLRPRTLPAGLVAAALLLGAAPALAGDAEESFLKAYYLEHEQGELQAALELYRAVAGDASASKELRQRAQTMASACAEELAASDFAHLVPEDTIVYFELNRPGDQLARLLGQLGLLAGSEGSGDVAVSPRLIHGLLGLRGAALAVTQIDPTGGPPGGVLILHPGDMDVVRGLIETVLPAGAQRVEPIGGHPTWSVEGQALVTTTERLVVASQDRAEIEGVLARLAGKGRDSLAHNPGLAHTMALRGEDLLFFCVNAEPVLPMVQALLAAQAGSNPEMAMVLDLSDVGSLRALAGRMGVDDSGVSLDLGLELAEGHRSVVFNLLRHPRLSAEGYRLVPPGAALFSVSTMNTAVDGHPGVTDDEGRPVVTVMDIGRELFANVRDVALYVMPSASGHIAGQPVPDVGLAFTVNDAERSRALWGLLLGIAQGATGGEVAPGKADVAGAKVDHFTIEDVSLYLFAKGDHLIVSPSKGAIEAAVDAARKGRSVLDDELYAGALSAADGALTSAFGMSLGRGAQLAKAFVPPRELAEMAPYLAMVESTVVTGSVRHSDTQLAVTARLAGLPKLGGMLSDLVHQQLHGGSTGRVHGVGQVPSKAPAVAVLAAEEDAPVRTKPAAAPAAAPVAVRAASVPPESAAKLRQALEKLVGAGAFDESRDLVRTLAQVHSGDALQLNNLAWALITEERYGNRFNDLALEMAQRASELTKHGNWYYLDTLGHALFIAGRLEEAVHVQRKAVEVAGGDARASEAKKALKRFEEALRGGEL